MKNQMPGDPQKQSRRKKWDCFLLIHCSKHLRDQTFKAIYLEIYWEKSFQIVVLFSRIIGPIFHVWSRPEFKWVKPWFKPGLIKPGFSVV